MDKKLEIQLGANRNANSIDVDTYDKIALQNKRDKILEFDIRNVLSVTEVYELERQATEVYRIYGGIEWMSMLNGLKNKYKVVEDFFTPNYCPEGESCTFKNIYDSFQFYLVRPSTGYTKITDEETQYIRYFEVVATPDDFDLFDMGYYQSIYGEQKQAFVFNKDFDVAGILDEFNFPLEDLYLYPQYNRETNGWNILESMQKRFWDTTSGTTGIKHYYPSTLAIGDRIEGDLINYYKSLFLQEQIQPAEYYIWTEYIILPNDEKFLKWKYDPFIPLKLRYFGEELQRANTGGTAYDQTSSIPYYATDLGGGNVLWKDILEQGYIDPLTGNGVDYPFVNKRRYLFSNIVLSVVPDLSDSNTEAVFNEISFAAPEEINTSPIGDLDDIGKPCQ